MTTKEARKLIGKPVMYRDTKGPSSAYWNEGTIQDVQGKNLKIQGNWLWLPDLIIQRMEP
jgi:ribosomal protein L35AE/L33A